jgi:hypothetical protein
MFHEPDQLVCEDVNKTLINVIKTTKANLL